VDQNKLENFNKSQQEVLESMRVSRIILPVLIGVGAVAYLLWRQFDPAEFARIDWTVHTLFWILLAIALAVLRHVAYAHRLRVLSQGVFSWKKCIELIFIWEFSSAVSPTSLGGSAVAFFILAQEKLSTAKTATIVLYTIVLDSLFLLGTLPILFVLFGSSIMRPGANNFVEAGGWGFYFLAAYTIMAAYSFVFYYGIFVNPRQLRRFLIWVTGISFLRRHRRGAAMLGDDMIVASEELRRHDWRFHLSVFASTSIAWIARFALLNCLINAFTSIPLDFWTQFELYSRLETMFFIIAFSPTPGGAGLIEVLFGGFLTDYVDTPTISTTISTIWRLISYYVYLFAGAIIIPNWIRKLVNERRRARQAQAGA
jgi:uncharacterized protein (TIRG00374 family)